MQAQPNKTRLYVLIVLTILSALFLILTLIPNSPLVTSNDCMDTAKAKKMYDSSNIKAKNKYIEARHSQCKTLLKYAPKPKNTYEQLDSCYMVDSVMDAYRHYSELHKRNSNMIKDEARFILKYLPTYSYCPQYEDVTKELEAIQ